MDTIPTQTNYHRRGNVGTLTLGGAIDIFEAQSVHQTAMRALNDAKAASVTIHLEQVERLDVAILQILLSLRYSLEASGRTLQISAPKRVDDAVAQLGMAL